ncbi:MAG TPA: hypothetical protein VMH81_22665 [Bryobacteraceae bacterium]|nr:hypothetical protein [Bryobacteraceae bacterium]
MLIARYYRNQHNLLMPIGLIASTSGPYLARASRVERVSIDPVTMPEQTIDLNQAADLMQRRCSKCHTLDRVVGARKRALVDQRCGRCHSLDRVYKTVQCSGFVLSCVGRAVGNVKLDA